MKKDCFGFQMNVIEVKAIDATIGYSLLIHRYHNTYR